MSRTEPTWLKRSAVLQMHTASIRAFGGSYGIRDEGMLDSALARPVNKYLYGQEDQHALAAAYAFGLSRNHAFVDGNKRIGFLAMAVFLECNGMTLTASDAEATAAMLELAAGSLDEDGLADWLREHTDPL